MGSTKNGARVPHVRNRFTSMDIGMNSQILPDMLINFALINITDRKNEGTNTIDGNWQADEGRRYRDNVRIYFLVCQHNLRQSTSGSSVVISQPDSLLLALVVELTAHVKAGFLKISINFRIVEGREFSFMGC